MQAVMAAVDRLAQSDAAVFVTGEKGTGKSLVAQRLHAASRRGALVRIDCAEERLDRLESELCDGMPTPGGVWDRAEGGVLLLDDITSMPIGLQQRLSRIVAESERLRTVRLLATSHRELAASMAGECLWPRLFEVLDPVEIPLPSLRQRRSDIPILVEHFLALYAQRHGRAHCRMETDAMVHLWQYDGPGNVRELESILERVVVLCRDGVIRTIDLPAHVRSGLSNGAAARRRAPALNGHSIPLLRPSA